MSFIVAIDGPSGTGKGTVTELISEKFNLMYLDTGATYRCVTLRLLNDKINFNDIEKIKSALNDVKIEFIDDKVFLDGKDVTKKIREEEVTKNVSVVSHIKEVRIAMVDLQRRMCVSKDAILEGRDIATNVFPNANVKIYLDASTDERVKRRVKQNKEKGIEMSEDDVRKNIEFRDYNDMHSDVGPLKRAEDAIYIDTTHLSIKQVVRKISKIIKKARKLQKRYEYAYAVTKNTKWKRFRRECVRHLFRFLYHLVYRMKIIGMEKIQNDEAVIICPNHLNYLDALAIESSSKRNIRFVCKLDLYKNSLFSVNFHLFDNIPVNRESESDVSSMKLCLKALKNNEAIGIFPEGTRKGFAKHVELMDGAAFLAYKTKTKIIPVGIKSSFIPFTKLQIKFGEPMNVENFKQDGISDKVWIKNATKELGKQIQELSK